MVRQQSLEETGMLLFDLCMAGDIDSVQSVLGDLWEQEGGPDAIWWLAGSAERLMGVTKSFLEEKEA